LSEYGYSYFYIGKQSRSKLFIDQKGHKTENVLKKLLLLLLLFFIIPDIYAQNTVISGKVTEKKTGNPIPYANIIFTETYIGTTSDINGDYKLSTAKPTQTIEISAIGYKKQVVPVRLHEVNTINFEMEEEVFALDEVKILPGENPAHRIFRNIIANKPLNDPVKLPSWKSRIYAKTEFDLKNVSSKLRNSKVLADFDFIFSYLDSMETRGKTFLPVFFTESVSNYYHDSERNKDWEEILASKTSGIKSDIFSEFTGKLYENVNIYDNFLTVSDIGLISPINPLGLQFYKYYLLDSVINGNQKIYEISFVPKLPQEPAFNGKMWVEDGSFAITKAEMQLSEKANVNFVNNLQYKVEFQKTDMRWAPRNEWIVADIDVQKNRNSEKLGLIARKTNIYDDFHFESVTDNVSNFKELITVHPEAVKRDEIYWESIRPIELQQREKNIYAMVDSIKDVKLFRTFAEYVYMFYYGYRDFGNVEFGPYYYLYSYNKVEGSRFRLGARTTYKFSEHLRLNGFGAYGTLDQKYKYGGGAEYFFSVKPLSKLALQGQHDMEMLGKSDNAFLEQNIMTTILSKQPNTKLNMIDRIQFTAQKEWRTGFLNELKITSTKIYSGPYVPFINGEGEEIPSVKSGEISFKLRYAPGEDIIQDDFERSTFSNYDPVISFQINKGFKGFMGGEYDYLKFHVGLSDRLTLNPIGYSLYYIQAGKIWGDVPFPFLKIHEGNETYAWDSHAFNLMNYQEFISDTYASVFWVHHFVGFFLNKVPVFRKLKWREIVGMRALWGNFDVEKHNSLVLPGNMKGLGKIPYTEASVGIENIFKIIRVDGVWRFNYNEDVKHQFGLLFSLQVTL